MINIPLVTYTVNNANILRVEAGTNCPRVGNSGYGGRTVLRFVNESCTDMRVRVDDGAVVAAQSIELVFGGGTEYETLVEALEFAVATLKGFPDTGRSMAQVE